jgi:hypothetical protein
MDAQNTLIHGDCIKATAQLAAWSIDFGLTDPPSCRLARATAVLFPMTAIFTGFARPSVKSTVCSSPHLSVSAFTHGTRQGTAPPQDQA